MVAGKRCLDVGASHGGFTDCLLKSGAASVCAVDVGYGLLDQRLRNDPRVRNLERTNFRFLEAETIRPAPTLTVVDVSFISLVKLMPKLAELLAKDGEIIALVKPQFEGHPREAPGGIVRDEAVRAEILARTRQEIERTGWRLLGQADSRIKGRRGNQETFFYLKRA
jgi:23S rRNA (cytidine1920-2'-O)/16S rRNA (cytidine1409-2'-O)-methyltransferase